MFLISHILNVDLIRDHKIESDGLIHGGIYKYCPKKLWLVKSMML